VVSRSGFQHGPDHGADFLTALGKAFMLFFEKILAIHGTIKPGSRFTVFSIGIGELYPLRSPTTAN